VNHNAAAAPDGPGQAGAFATTHWSLVLRARDKSEAALETLFGQYREPLLVWLRCQSFAPEDAEDLLQGFLEGLLRREALSTVAREKGRFRTFLLACLKHHLRDERDKKMATKRGAGQPTASLDETDQDGRALHQPASADITPDLAFDRAWAESVMANSLHRLADECASQGHAALYAALEPVMFSDDTASPYREIGSKLGMSEAAVKMAASRIRARLRGLVRDQIMQTVADETDWEDEVRYLIRLFGRGT